MNRIACLLVSASLLSSGVVFAQGELDAYRYSQTELNGTARYLGMGGAFGALGGDISSMSSNPAGLGIYRSSEIVTTLSLSSIKAKSDWGGSKVDANKTKFNFDNIAYVGYFPTGNDEGLIGWNVGFSYNRVKNFNRNYRLRGTQNYSLADYAAAKASYAGTDRNSGEWFGIPKNEMPPFGVVNNESDLVYDKLGAYNGGWLSGLAYQSGMIGANQANVNDTYYHSAFAEWDQNNQNWYSDSRPDDVGLDVSESGAIDQYDFSFATNISNRVFIGATIAVTDLNYRMSSSYFENYLYTDNSMDYLDWGNTLRVDGTGYSFNLGVIVRPADYLRLGVAYNSPIWYKMTDSYWGYADTHNENYPEDPDVSGETPASPYPYTNYKLRTADKWIFSVAGIIGQTALISLDYELGNYKYMKLSDPYGYEHYEALNHDLIQKDFGLAHTLKLGAEVKITPQFAVRAGANWRTSPMKKEFREGAFEVFPAGTVAHYTLDKGTISYSVGLGYRFTPNFYMDLACVYRQYKEDAYTFSKVIIEDNNGLHTLVDSEAIGLKTNTTQVALTLGYKF